MTGRSPNFGATGVKHCPDVHLYFAKRQHVKTIKARKLTKRHQSLCIHALVFVVNYYF